MRGRSTRALLPAARRRIVWRSSVRIYSSVGLMLMLWASSVEAATITVDDAGDNDTAGDQTCTLREAINNANEVSGADTTGGDCATGDGGAADVIVFAASLVASTITLNGTTLPVITEALTIIGPTAGDPSGITVSGNDVSRILDALGAAPSAFVLELSSVTLTGGSEMAQGQRGSAARVRNADLLIRNGLVTNNSTAGQNANGGALFVGDGNALLEDTTVSGNSTSGQNACGGGLGVEDGNGMLLRSTLSGNSTFGQNADGGAMAVLRGDATLVDSTLSGNSTATPMSNAKGGGLYVNEGNVVLQNSTVSGNTTVGEDADGGGVALEDGNLTMTNSTVSGNTIAGTSADGGGVYVRDTLVTPSDSVVTHSSVVSNAAADGTDGIHIERNHTDTMLTLASTLVVQAGASEAACSPMPPADPVSTTIATDISCNGAVATLAEINLGPLADNGGSTQTHAPLASSIAIDAAGDCVATFAISTDQRGSVRPVGEQCDIGSVEVGVCGDGALDPANDETCDDGNTDDGDGCSSICTEEIPADGGVDAGIDAGIDAGMDAGVDAGVDAGANPGGGGGSGCAVGPVAPKPTIWGWAAFAVATLLAHRRRRRGREEEPTDVG